MTMQRGTIGVTKMTNDREIMVHVCVPDLEHNRINEATLNNQLQILQVQGVSIVPKEIPMWQSYEE